MTKALDGDKFARTLEQIFDNLQELTEEELSDRIAAGLKYGRNEWKDQAIQRGWGPKDGHRYYKHGKPYFTGRYVRSIRSHMVEKDGETPWGEIGSPKMPGLAHLLENGHASPAGGRVRPYKHVAPAAEVTFKVVERGVDEMIDIVLDRLMS